ncbi:unnamed protein product [Adineta steineri]|uniref:Uncharacterized protein n=1 Tax=Adineta steineri TaxID=433720 RepID=A0A819LTM1_9BILA|nr:unnamed protein product [Adineta steineri]CAF4103520.1 unnamed protein product [Adineta steineri]
MVKLVGLPGVDVLNGLQVQLDISGKAAISVASVWEETEVIVSLWKTIARTYLREVQLINVNATVLYLAVVYQHAACSRLFFDIT